MRGRFQTWTRIRVNLQHVPAELRPKAEPLDPDDDVNDWPSARYARDGQASATRARPEDGGISEAASAERKRRTPSRARKES
jgi:hypothetical protein